MTKEKDDELVVCIYDEQGLNIEQKLLEIFDKYIKSSLQKVNS